MRDVTREALDELQAVDWFSRVGQPNPDFEPVTWVGSWREALHHCLSQQWQDLKYEAGNMLWIKIGWISVARQMQWNGLVDEIRPITDALVATKSAKAVKENKLPAQFVQEVQWDILHLAMEGEYLDIFPGGFYRDLSTFYLTGHFPCGWDGDRPPRGKFLIY